MRPLRVVIAAVATALVTAGTSSCGVRPTYTPVRAGSEQDIAAFVGDWEGEYAGAASGRSGYIMFSLRPGDRIAEGSVTMAPAGFGGYITQPHPVPRTDNRAATHARTLTIAFCRVSGRQVIGRLDAYWDPDCQCRVETTFSGELADDGLTIAGTFSTVGDDLGMERTGRWRVRRVAVPVP